METFYVFIQKSKTKPLWLPFKKTSYHEKLFVHCCKRNLRFFFCQTGKKNKSIATLWMFSWCVNVKLPCWLLRMWEGLTLWYTAGLVWSWARMASETAHLLRAIRSPLSAWTEKPKCLRLTVNSRCDVTWWSVPLREKLRLQRAHAGLCLRPSQVNVQLGGRERERVGGLCQCVTALCLTPW